MATVLPKVNMAAHMVVIRVGEEAEAVMMTDATHVVVETAQMTLVAEMVTIIAVVVVLAHAPDLLQGTTVPAIGATGMIERVASQEKFDETIVEEVEAQKAARPAVTAHHH